MKANELNKAQLTELKESYLIMLADQGEYAEVMGVDYDEPSYYDLANVNDLISDEYIIDYYGDCDFVEDDFFTDSRD